MEWLMSDGRLDAIQPAALVELAGSCEGSAGYLLGVETAGAGEGAVLIARQRPLDCLRREVVAEPRQVLRLPRWLLHPSLFDRRKRERRSKASTRSVGWR